MSWVNRLQTSEANREPVIYKENLSMIWDPGFVVLYFVFLLIYFWIVDEFIQDGTGYAILKFGPPKPVAYFWWCCVAS